LASLRTGGCVMLGTTEKARAELYGVQGERTVAGGTGREADAAEPVVQWGSGPRPVLLLHGFSGGPQDLRLLGEALAARGFRAVAPTLPGHGAELRGLGGVREEDWLLRGLAQLEA